ncbi:hypothetical protein F365_109 [Campylobacter phage F365]|uniref:Uncharacterized protein n=1 Tax=Campylobacter phage F365 TaxID=2794370 RepID=A0A7T3KG28_9CAUD|nr:hypothetical protein F365_109 [Campylobacter phage F365]
MIKDIVINNKHYYLNVWKIKDEIGILHQFIDWIELPLEDQINKIADILIPQTKDLDYISRLYTMIILSSYANGDYSDILLTCPHCGNPIDTRISIRENLEFIPPKTVEVEINNKKHTISKQNIELCNELPLKDYNSILNQLNDDGDLKLCAKVKCIMCNNNVLAVRELKDLFENYVIMLDLEWYYSTLKYFISQLGFSKTDFDSLYPFEIELLTNEDKNE